MKWEEKLKPIWWWITKIIYHLHTRDRSLIAPVAITGPSLTFPNLKKERHCVSTLLPFWLESAFGHLFSHVSSQSVKSVNIEMFKMLSFATELISMTVRTVQVEFSAGLKIYLWKSEQLTELYFPVVPVQPLVVVLNKWEDEENQTKMWSFLPWHNMVHGCHIF